MSSADFNIRRQSAFFAGNLYRPSTSGTKLTTLCLGCLLASANATALSWEPYPITLIETTGPNTLGRPVGDRLAISVRDVDPKFTTFVTAQRGANSAELKPILSSFSAGVFFPREHWAYVDLSPSTSGPWQVSVTDVANPAGTTLTAEADTLAPATPIALPENLQVDTSTGALSPTVSWTNPVTYDTNRLRLIDTRTNMRVAEVFFGSNVPFDEFAVPEGVLAPTGQYTFRVMGIDNQFDTRVGQTRGVARANSYINYEANSAVREAGDVGIFSPSGDTGESITPGANNFPGTSIAIGNSSFGSATIDAASSLVSTFVNVGRNGSGFGNLLIDGGSVELYGSDGFSNSNGGFLTVGRSGQGFASIINGGSVTLNANEFGTASSFDTPGLNIGRDSGSKGTLVVDNTSTITINGWDGATTLGEYGIIGVGRSGIGRMDIRGGSVVSNDPRGITVIGQRIPGAPQAGQGAVNVVGTGSTLNAGAVLRIGDITGGGGQGYLSVRDGGEVKANFINVHDGGALTGDGLVTGTVTAFSGGVISPGNSPGTLTIDGDLILDGGTLFLEAYSETEIDKIVVTGDAIFGAGSIQALLGFDPTDLLDFFDIAGTTTILDDFGGVGVTAIPGSDAPIGSLVGLDLTGESNSSDVVILAEVKSAVPLSPTILLLIGGLLVLVGQMHFNSCYRQAS